MKLIEFIGKHCLKNYFVTFYGGDLQSLVINIDEIIQLTPWTCDIVIDDESIAEPYNGDCTSLTYKTSEGESNFVVFEPYRSLLDRLKEGIIEAPLLTRLDLICDCCGSGLPANYDSISNSDYEKFKEAEAKRNKNE